VGVKPEGSLKFKTQRVWDHSAEDGPRKMEKGMWGERSFPVRAQAAMVEGLNCNGGPRCCVVGFLVPFSGTDEMLASLR
jgi:hypothetical protein